MYLVFDTETTGFAKRGADPVTDPDKWPRIVQLAWKVVGDESYSHEFIIKPDGFEIPFGAYNVHKISTKRALSEGHDLKMVIDLFLDSCKGIDLLVAHNMEYDWGCLSAELSRMGCIDRLPQKPRVCTMESSVALCKLPRKTGGYKYPKLTELHMHLFGKDFSGAHNALNDVNATADCYAAMVSRGIL